VNYEDAYRAFKIAVSYLTEARRNYIKALIRDASRAELLEAERDLAAARRYVDRCYDAQQRAALTR
jgi:hypothetical protein